MNNAQDTIDNIKQGNFTTEDLNQYLNSSLVLVKANAIMAIIKRKIDEISIINKLYQISLRTDQESKVIGLWTNGHLAMAALKLLSTSESLALYENAINKFDNNTQKDIEHLIEQIQYII